MLQIAVWGVAGLLAVLSTLPVFITRSAGTAAGGRGWAFAVMGCGIAFAAFLVYAAAEQAGALSGSRYEATPASPGALDNPFLTK